MDRGKDAPARSACAEMRMRLREAAQRRTPLLRTSGFMLATDGFMLAMFSDYSKQDQRDKAAAAES
eukprot:3617494-Heterocapsa_arctica.AAC.1